MNISKERKLIETVTSLDDFFEASSALTDLSSINEEKTEELALEILENKRGDVQLQACAFELLYSVNQIIAFKYIKCNAGSVDPYIFKSMLGAVTEDSSMVDEDLELLSIVMLLNRELDKIGYNGLKRIGDVSDWFKITFKDKIP